MLSKETVKRGGLAIWSGTPNLKKEDHDILPHTHNTASFLLRALSDGKFERSVLPSGKHESAAGWCCLQNMLYKVTTVLSRHRDVGRCYLRTPSAIMEQSLRVHDILYFMLLNKKTTGCPKSRLTKIVNIVIFVVCFPVGNSPAFEFHIPTFRNILSIPSS
jgi:hypothetical protein